MKIKNAGYVKGAATFGQCLRSPLPQIAVAGKSNVGKSSFINRITNDGNLARTSKLPGRTRLINYFAVNTDCGEFLLTDLPGYGFAKVSDEEKRKWATLMESYLAQEQRLAHVFFLVDIRHDPTRDDVTMYNYLFANNLPFTVVATKADKVSKSQVRNRVRSIAAFLKVGEGNVIALSSLTEAGKQQVLDRIQQVLESNNAAKEQQE